MAWSERKKKKKLLYHKLCEKITCLKMFSKQDLEVYKLFQSATAVGEWCAENMRSKAESRAVEVVLELIGKKKQWAVSSAAFEWGEIFLLHLESEQAAWETAIAVLKSPASPNHGLAAPASSQKTCSHHPLFPSSSSPSSVTGTACAAQGVLRCMATRDEAFHRWFMSSCIKTNKRKKNK